MGLGLLGVIILGVIVIGLKMWLNHRGLAALLDSEESGTDREDSDSKPEHNRQ